MTDKEAKALIFKWLKGRDFVRIKIPGALPYNYVHSLGEFSVIISFYKDRFDDYLMFYVGCHFDNCQYGRATIDVKYLQSNKNNANNPQGFYYSELTEEQLIRCLDEMFEKYLKPYYDQGRDYLKIILLKQYNLFKDQAYIIQGGAREKINKMFGLNIQHSRVCLYK